MDLQRAIDNSITNGKLPANIGIRLQKFFLSYAEALKKRDSNITDHLPILTQFLELVIEELQHPSKFEPFHQRQRIPVDFYKFGLELIRPLVIFERSHVYNIQQLDIISAQLTKGENVILLANHQTEPDPQAIELLLEKTHPQLAEKIISVAGDRVTSDPLAVPFSKGCNLLCIYSKKHIDNPPEKKAEKLLHNKKTMQRLGSLLVEGGKIIYVAPSGGRDRPNEKGIVEVARFDPQSIEMFRLTARQSMKPCHFYPLALDTYNLLPPPSSVEKELGERRLAQCTPINISVGEEIDMRNFHGIETTNKHELRQKRADAIWKLVETEYRRITSQR